MQLCERPGKIFHKSPELPTGQPQAEMSKLSSRGSYVESEAHYSAKTHENSFVYRQQLILEFRGGICSAVCWRFSFTYIEVSNLMRACKISYVVLLSQHFFVSFLLFLNDFKARTGNGRAVFSVY